MSDAVLIALFCRALTLADARRPSHAEHNGKFFVNHCFGSDVIQLIVWSYNMQ